MKKFLLFALFILGATLARAQATNPILISTTDPSGACPTRRIDLSVSSGNPFYCNPSTGLWSAFGASSGTVTSVVIAGTANKIQVTGTCTITSTGTCTITIPDTPTLVTPTIASFVNATHTHLNAAGGGTLAEGALALTDVTTNDCSITKHGFTPKAPNDATKYLDGTCNYSAPSGGGGGVISYSAPGLTLTANTYFAPPGGGGIPSTTEANSQVKAPSAATVSNFQVTVSVAPGMGNSYAFTWRKAGADQASTCTIADTATTCTDTTHSFNVAQGDLIDVKIVSLGTIITTPMVSWLAAFGTTNVGVTSVSFTGGIISVATGTTTPALSVAGTSGGIPYFASGSTWASSAALAANALVIGGGAGAAPSTTTTGTGILTFLGTPSSANLASAITNETGSGALVFATSPTLVTPVLGTPASGDASNLTNIPVDQAKSGALLPLANLLLPTICSGRLTTETGVPISTSDRTAQGTIYFTPYLGSTISLYSGSAWAVYSFSEISLALTITSGKNYDVFVYNNSGTITLELSAAWTDDNTRATALTTQDGVYVKNGATTRRYVGTIRASGTNQTSDSGGGTTTQVGGQRYVYNYYNRVNRALSVFDSTSSWTYNSTTYRQANGASGNKVEFVIGQPEDAVSSTVAWNSAAVAFAASVGIGLDSTNTPSGFFKGVHQDATGSNSNGQAIAFYQGTPTTAGYHYLAALEASGGTSATFFGAPSSLYQGGLTAMIRN